MMRFEFATFRYAHADGAACVLFCPARHVRLQSQFQQFFARFWQPAQLPELLKFENVILAERDDSACLYDPQGWRIDESALPRRTRELEPVFHRAAPVLENIDVTDVVEEPVVWQSLFFPHWGHFLLESVSRLWANEPGSHVADCASLFSYPAGSDEIAPPFATFLSAAGARLLRRTRKGEARLAQCYVPRPSFELYALAHPYHLRAPHRVARNLLLDNRRDPRPVYLSRRKLAETKTGARLIENEATLELELARHGVRIAYMEQLSLAEQVKIVNAHDVFVGPWGSAMHNILFSLRGREITTFVLIFGALPRDFLLVDSIVGNRAHYLDVMRPAEGSPDPNLLRLDIDKAVSYLHDCGVV